MSDRRLAAAAVVVVTLAAALSASLGGTLGLALVGVVTAACVVLGVAVAAGSRPADLPRRPAGEDALVAARATFPSYDRIAALLRAGQQSPRHFDSATRPLLQALAEERLAERRGVDLRTDAAAARELLGADVWPLVDPARPPAADGSGGGVDADRLALLVTRLEEL